MTRIGFVGLGNMGTPMAQRLADAGNDLSVYDSSASARDRFTGVANVRVLDVVFGVAVDAEVVILMLPDSNVVEHVLLTDGLLQHIAPGATVVDMSSSEPMRTRALAALAAERGVTLIDAPVSGGVGGARSGSLAVMVGGPPETFAALQPMFSTLGSRVVHAGNVVGSGHAVKALNNLMSAAHLMVSAEAVHAAAAFGLDPVVTLDIVNGSSGKSASTENKWPKFILPGTYDSGFGLRLMIKDLGVALALQHATGTPAPLSEAALAVWSAAGAELPADADHTEVAKWVGQHMESNGL